MFNIFILTYCSDLESIKNETEIIESIKQSDKYYKGLITILAEDTEYEIRLSHADGFTSGYVVISNADSGELLKVTELEPEAISWQQNFILPFGKYDIYYPSYIEVFYSKSEGSSEFVQQSEVHSITLHAYDENDNIIASASGSANTSSKARSIAESYLKSSAPDAVEISEQIKTKKKSVSDELISLTMKLGKIDKIFVNCQMVTKADREEFSEKVRVEVKEKLQMNPTWSLHWEDGDLIKFAIHAKTMKNEEIKIIEELIETIHKQYSEH